MGVWLDFDSLANTDATHGTFLLSGSLAGKTSGKLTLGGRFGFGSTLVNFHEPAFDDVQASNFRFEATIDYAVGASWSLWARPFSIDIMTASELGGPITTLQMRVGLAYTFGAHRKAPIAQQQQQQQQQQPAPTAPTTPTTPTTQARNP
jgi:hypothetical protein